MTEHMQGFPYWQLQFGEQGEAVSVPTAAAMAADLHAAGVTDLFLFSHGWNNSQQAARDLYGRFFGQMAQLASGSGGRQLVRADATIGVAGVIWPSLLWADEPAPGASGAAVGSGGAAAVGRPAPTVHGPSDEALVQQLKAVFSAPAECNALDQLAVLLQTRPANPADLQHFQQLMGVLVPSRASGSPEEQGQRAVVEQDYRVAFDRMATAAQIAQVPLSTGAGGAASIGDSIAWLWDGAKQALREATYYTMKERAGVVGQQGLGPFIASLQPEAQAQGQTLRVHLLGHSFGARLVAFTLMAPHLGQGAESPVKSLTLLQGAFSHFAFAPSLPQAPSRAGALNGANVRVDGPLTASFSDADTAVGVLYPSASLAAGQNASNASDPFYPWGAMGHDGAQAVGATVIPYGPPGTSYPFAVGKFFNLDGNQVIVNGGPPSGAHGDICHPETAWAVLAAAGLSAVH